MSDLCDARGAAADPPADATASVDVHVDIVAKMVRLWSTNDPPLDSESAVLTDVLESTRVRLGAVDAELAGLKARVQCLEQDRSDLSSLEANVANVLSPLRRVPRDILAEIFDWTLDPTEPAPWELCPCAPLSIATSPWVLTHVSSLWRAVAVASPLMCRK
ncbi:hypothetical protein MSAN_02529200 [Mycena sanguinolenta]|uniref:F-box domain-containing protein n=1 Tax=Mycena sanguinolenta TaxID=230812 RepID=A0A8H6TWF0_9AGAR|nr:hypothetical protein MSAN_02529200 [Mycena sanguinolenta]